MPSLQLAGLEKRPYLGGFAIVMVPNLHQPTPEIRALATRVCESLSEVRALFEVGEL